MGVSAPTWARAQQLEAAWWQRADTARACDLGHAWYAGMLGITPAEVNGRRVLDLGGGPRALGRALALARYVVVDPLAQGPEAVRSPAEDYVPDGQFDEVWIYNVLQHVIDPIRVLGVAMLAGAQRPVARIRLFEWLETPVTDIHPHSFAADFFDAAFRGWRSAWRVEGVATGEGWRQRFLAAVWERS